MRVKFLKSIASEHFAFRPKQEAEIEDGLAVKWIASGVAAPAVTEIETAVKAAPENAARRTSKR